jgi:hypothetical protein
MRLLNEMDVSARLMTQASFRTRPFTLMAASFKSRFPSDFARNLHMTLRSTVSEHPPSFSSRFGKIIDKQLMWAVKHGVAGMSLPGSWSDANASFVVLPHAPLKAVHLCRETDALDSGQVVRACEFYL